jgi:hypothetical protein
LSGNFDGFTKAIDEVGIIRHNDFEQTLNFKTEEPGTLELNSNGNWQVLKKAKIDYTSEKTSYTTTRPKRGSSTTTRTVQRPEKRKVKKTVMQTVQVPNPKYVPPAQQQAKVESTEPEFEIVEQTIENDIIQDELLEEFLNDELLNDELDDELDVETVDIPVNDEADDNDLSDDGSPDDENMYNADSMMSVVAEELNRFVSPNDAYYYEPEIDTILDMLINGKELPSTDISTLNDMYSDDENVSIKDEPILSKDQKAELIIALNSLSKKDPDPSKEIIFAQSLKHRIPDNVLNNTKKKDCRI